MTKDKHTICTLHSDAEVMRLKMSGESCRLGYGLLRKYYPGKNCTGCYDSHRAHYKRVARQFKPVGE